VDKEGKVQPPKEIAIETICHLGTQVKILVKLIEEKMCALGKNII